MSSSSDSIDPKRRNQHTSIVGLCLFLTTTGLLCSANFLHGHYSSGVSRSNPMQALRDRASDLSIPTPTTAFHTTTRRKTKHNGSRRKLDFLIAAFPKCGTTTLVHAFADHNETDISLSEKCVIAGENLTVGLARNKLDEVVAELSPDPNVKRGAKCPIALRNHRVLSRLKSYSTQTKLIIGVRHPVRFMESHYNYRITELYDKDLIGSTTVPPIETLVGRNEWRGVSVRNARFEAFLLQLGKTDMTTRDLDKLTMLPQMAVVPNTFKVFIYSLEQMQDTNTTRRELLQRELETFLDMKHPMKPFGHMNLNHFVGRKAHKETIDICSSSYDNLRNQLAAQGRETQRWIRNKFLKSLDVTVANQEHFLQTLESWDYDPCATEESSDATKVSSLRVSSNNTSN